MHVTLIYLVFYQGKKKLKHFSKTHYSLFLFLTLAWQARGQQRSPSNQRQDRARQARGQQRLVLAIRRGCDCESENGEGLIEKPKPQIRLISTLSSLDRTLSLCVSRSLFMSLSRTQVCWFVNVRFAWAYGLIVGWWW